MSSKLGLVCFVGISFVAGCAADPAADRSASVEAAASSWENEAESAARLAGAYKDDNGSPRAAFEGIVFQANGDFFADVDTGIRCITTPCPSRERLVGTFQATRTLVRLEPATNSTERSSLYGVYRYQLDGGRLALTRASEEGDGWKNTLSKEGSYCAEPTDCDRQDLTHVACAGAWVCGAAHACGYSCGVGKIDDPAPWPVDRTKLVAETSGGGFTPPPASGSTCRLGAAKYVFDVEARKLSWTKCRFLDWETPMHPYSGERSLRPAEVAMIDAAMKDVVVTHRDMCGADKPYLTIHVSSAAQGTQRFVDSFYACYGGEGDVFVDEIDGVFGALDAITD